MLQTCTVDRVQNNTTVFCIVTPCSSETGRRCRGARRWYVLPKIRALSDLHGVTTQKAICPSETSGYLRITRCYNSVGDMFFRNVGIPQNYTVLQFSGRYVLPIRRTASELHGVTIQKAICPSETSGCLRTTRHYNSEGDMSFRNVGMPQNYTTLQSRSAICSS
jgi:hypothetical protein